MYILRKLLVSLEVFNRYRRVFKNLPFDCSGDGERDRRLISAKKKRGIRLVEDSLS